MKVGTKSVLFGVHQFLLHPFFVFWAWCKLFGFPFDPRLWIAFFVHDLGYIGKPNMDGPEGETHPEPVAKIMGAVFGKKWGDFVLLHSRFYSKKLHRPYSRLCVADKLATALIPAWMYLPLARASGELTEYMLGVNARTPAGNMTEKEWLREVQRVCHSFAYLGVYMMERNP